MRDIFFILMLTIGVGACSSEEESLPIPEDRLAKVLVDVHFAEAAMQDVPASIRDSMGLVYYNQIYKIHDITEQELNKSLRLIKEDPEKLEDVYEKVEAELERQTNAER